MSGGERAAVPEMVIVPYEHFGPVRFDATEEEVIDVLGPPDAAFSLEYTGGRQLSYHSRGIAVEFDDTGHCSAVECDPEECLPVVGDLRLVGGFAASVRALRERGFEVRLGPEPDECYDAYCDQLGIILWRESEEKENIDSVSAVRRGYGRYVR